MIKRYLCFILALLCVLSFSIACAPKDSGGRTDGTTNQADTDGDGYDPEKTALQNALAMYNGVDLDAVKGQEFVILSPSPGEHFYYITSSTENEVFYEEPSSDPLSNAVYNRNRKVEDALGITIKAMWGGNWDGVNNIVTLNDGAGSAEYNTVITRMDNEMTYATNGQLLNFYDIPSMNVENRWWDKNIVNTFTIYGNVLYVLTGDINYYDDYSVQAVLFNKSMSDELKLDYPYQAVRDGTWTVDMMTQMAMVAKADSNGDDVYTPGVDRLGLADDMDCVLHFLYPYGQMMSTVNADGEPEVVWPNDINTPIVEKIVDIFTSDYVSRDTGNNLSYFSKNKIYMYCSLIGSLPGLRNMETDFGIVPMPKGDASMEGYRAYMSNGWSTSYAVPKVLSSDKAYDTGMILECMSAASADIITPALYDQLLEAKYIRDEESKEMLSYILDSKVYDWAGDLAWASSIRNVYQSLPNTGAGGYARSMKKVENTVNAALKELCDGLRPK